MREMEAGFNVMNESKTYVLLRHLGAAETTSLMISYSLLISETD